MTPVVIDASAGTEVVLDSARGRALARLLPQDAVGWVPEHFYAEVLGVVRRRLVVDKMIMEPHATAALGRLRQWHLHRAAVELAQCSRDRRSPFPRRLLAQECRFADW